MRIQDSKCVWDRICPQNTIGFHGIYKKRDNKCLLDSMDIRDSNGKWLLDSMGVWDSKCFWDTMCLQDTIGFQVIYKKNGGKRLLDDMGIWDRDGKW